MAIFLHNSLTSGLTGMLISPHQISSLVVSSNTTLLSFGERPYLRPEEAHKAPVELMQVSVVSKSTALLLLMACS
jgi:hypothetical protein